MSFLAYQCQAKLYFVKKEMYKREIQIQQFNWIFRKEKFHFLLTTNQKKIHSFASIWYEIGVLWPKIKPVKSHTTALGFWIQTGMNHIFQMKYFTFFYSQEAAKIFEVKVKGRKENCQLGPSRTQCNWGRLNLQIFYRPPTLTFDIFATSWPTRMHSSSF